MEILRTIEAVRAYVALRRPNRVAFVPTMGFLHEGHLSLMHLARGHGDTVLSSIFVNPTQFGPTEDLSRYPRDEEGDLEKCRAAGCDAVFLPPLEVMYPPGHRTRVVVHDLTAPLCGASRPGHFDGVCTVVLKLFAIVGCDAAVFGEKDYQQLAVIRQMVRDLDLPVEIVGGPIVREPDGLAMSSRNVYLGPDARSQATCLSRGVRTAAAAWGEGERRPGRLVEIVRGVIAEAPLANIDYVDARGAGQLEALDMGVPAAQDVLVALAVRFGGTRLIDNTVLRV